MKPAASPAKLNPAKSGPRNRVHPPVRITPRLSPETHPEIAAVSHQAARRGSFAEAPSGLPASVRQALARAGVEMIYSHQAEALRLAQEGKNVVVTTASASGKSLCFNLPVLSELAGNRHSRALYLYPTKALTQDQVRKLQSFRLPFAKPGIYDGDTPSEQRTQIRKKANIVLSNPDMLHVGILPHHDSWADFFFNLKYVIIDEAHSYRGVFGSHVANVVRRLRRICALYGSEPQFLLTTATIANPEELAVALTGLGHALVNRDGSPRGERQIVFWNPPVTDKSLGTRKSAFGEASMLLARLLRAGSRTIVFARTRKGAELIFSYTRRLLEEEPALAAAISPYRGGYTPGQRREIEKGLFEGRLLGVVSTSALELGIDVGGLDAVISVTFPGTVASLRQQWGRAGRGGEQSLAVFIAGLDALDQYFMSHPDQLLERDPEAAILDFTNDQIFSSHLGAAAFEAPLTPADEAYFGSKLAAAAAALVTAGALRQKDGNFVWARPDFPAASISLRSSSADSFAIVQENTGAVIGEVEAERAFIFVHPGAIYLHMGETFQVVSLDLAARVALVRPVLVDFYTQPKKETSVEIEEPLLARTAGGVRLSFGRLLVTEQVIAYQKKLLADNQVLEIVDLELPQQTFVTEGLWFALPEEIYGKIEPRELLGAAHAAEHGLIALLPLFAMCDRWDIGGLSTGMHWQTGGPSIFVYDGHPGGIGITRAGFDEFEELAAGALKLISCCPCESGCPSCIQSPKCGNLNEPLNKEGAIMILQGITRSF
ncbi:MAG: DEAD/DEAH box helicase [Actinobacteria bacterium]|nr:DEAD/DEAH box helicase [Actinomycetota bacterium]